MTSMFEKRLDLPEGNSRKAMKSRLKTTLDDVFVEKYEFWSDSLKQLNEDLLKILAFYKSSEIDAVQLLEIYEPLEFEIYDFNEFCKETLNFVFMTVDSEDWIDEDWLFDEEFSHKLRAYLIEQKINPQRFSIFKKLTNQNV